VIKSTSNSFFRFSVFIEKYLSLDPNEKIFFMVCKEDYMFPNSYKGLYPKINFGLATVRAIPPREPVKILITFYNN
jgi:hypothetical protein